MIVTSRSEEMSDNVSDQTSITPHTSNIPAWILKMAEDERCYEEAKKQAKIELERCRTHVLREFEQQRKQCEDAHRSEMDAMRQQLDRRIKELEKVQTDIALNKVRRLSMDHSFRSREEREKKMREVKDSSKQVFNKERKRFSIGIEQLMEQKQLEHREQMNKLAIQEAKALQQLEEVRATIHADEHPARPTSR
ncbi:hypothetical protein KIN20_003194 [Parelaphostrongylus tenuis]|uniref:Uncharacterized protein n=1 Tax=Parelaphostrongylus tenuis TaxID=148309 RepID=A0AAD5M0Y8_PARTN|nr:hypothetical protein KIN20_003194 [Parelaphostrongylus tenuis]